MKIKLINLAVSLLPKLKGMIWADGKFAPKRAVTLLVALSILMFGIHQFGTENVEVAVELLDQVSDVIGYEE